ncbi:ubiquitin-related domain-containing protein [Tanacetum coccineum]
MTILVDPSVVMRMVYLGLDLRLTILVDPVSKMASLQNVRKGKKKQVAPTRCYSNYINLKVVSPLESLNPNFRVNRDAPLKQLMIEWAARANVDYTVVRFIHDGKRVQAHNTPNEFKMEDEDCIDAWTECGGGH